MPHWPEALYDLTPRDEQVTPLELVQQHLTVNDLATTLITPTYTVPLGKILCVNSVVLQTTAGAAQTQRWAQFYFFNRGDVVGNKFLLGAVDFDARSPNTNRTTYSQSTGNLTAAMIPEGCTVGGEALFSAAVAANDFQLFFTGVLIPRGNFAV